MAEFTGPTNDIVGDAIIAEIADQTMELRTPAGENATLDLRNKDAVAEVIFADNFPIASMRAIVINLGLEATTIPKGNSARLANMIMDYTPSPDARGDEGCTTPDRRPASKAPAGSSPQSVAKPVLSALMGQVATLTRKIFATEAEAAYKNSDDAAKVPADAEKERCLAWGKLHKFRQHRLLPFSTPIVLQNFNFSTELENHAREMLQVLNDGHLDHLLSDTPTKRLISKLATELPTDAPGDLAVAVSKGVLSEAQLQHSLVAVATKELTAQDLAVSNSLVLKLKDSPTRRQVELACDDGTEVTHDGMPTDSVRQIYLALLGVDEILSKQQIAKAKAKFMPAALINFPEVRSLPVAPKSSSSQFGKVMDDLPLGQGLPFSKSEWLLEIIDRGSAKYASSPFVQEHGGTLRSMRNYLALFTLPEKDRLKLIHSAATPRGVAQLAQFGHQTAPTEELVLYPPAKPPKHHANAATYETDICTKCL
eukprot:CAMPEP_0171720096 /NCGR_PEP_ID=MMETSP0991-20121206/21579_1 /TAXON_ID=483369 /ORGANISM="non described non described, Strain CCMP2098" /LENGTH=481 /DNA_ID=CAMNT_0012311747 /DNA_START=372 /DNA_END=1817 /DNA_ORIENTATION=-